MDSYALPPLYRPWMDAALGQPVISEPRATCNNCALCTYPERPAQNDHYFNPNTKCCAYHPTLPNYLVGAVLSDQDPSFVESKEQFIRGALAAEISPMGIGPSYFTRMFYRLKEFGKHEQVRCPFYMHLAGGMCGIWKYRNARCSTWFCKHERGRVGLRFWSALDDMMAFAEKRLADRCVTELSVIIPETPSDQREAIWGNWAYREIEFFQACWDKVSLLNWAEVLKIGGSELESLVERTRIALSQLSSSNQMDALRKSEFSFEDVGDGIIRIWAYSNYNPLDLPHAIVDVLDYFDGRPVDQVIDQIEKEKGIKIDRALLDQLTDYEILVPAESTPDRQA